VAHLRGGGVGGGLCPPVCSIGAVFVGLTWWDDWRRRGGIEVPWVQRLIIIPKKFCYFNVELLYAPSILL